MRSATRRRSARSHAYKALILRYLAALNPSRPRRSHAISIQPVVALPWEAALRLISRPDLIAQPNAHMIRSTQHQYKERLPLHQRRCSSHWLYPTRHRLFFATERDSGELLAFQPSLNRRPARRPNDFAGVRTTQIFGFRPPSVTSINITIVVPNTLQM